MIIADSSILASFAAATGLNLLLAALRVEVIHIPPAAEHELREGLNKGAMHLEAIIALIKTGGIQVLPLTDEDRAQMTILPGSFGQGERQAVALCLHQGSTLLCNDKQVVNYCARKSVTCLELSALLRLLWRSGVASQAKVKTMIIRMEKVEGLVFKDRNRVFAPEKGELF